MTRPATNSTGNYGTLHLGLPDFLSPLFLGISYHPTDAIGRIAIRSQADLDRIKKDVSSKIDPTIHLFTHNDNNLDFFDEVPLEKLSTIEDLRQWVSNANKTMFMHGDCWHLALALNRLYGLPLVAFTRAGGATPDHIAVSFHGVDGPYLDIRGPFVDSGFMTSDGLDPRVTRRLCTTPSIVDPEQVVAFWKQESGDDIDIRDPIVYPFAQYATWVAETVFDRDFITTIKSTFGPIIKEETPPNHP
jgi:hypothetical protein